MEDTDIATFDFTTVPGANRITRYRVMKAQATNNLRKIMGQVERGEPIIFPIEIARLPVKNLDEMVLSYRLRGTQCPEVEAVRDALITSSNGLEKHLDAQGPYLMFVAE